MLHQYIVVGNKYPDWQDFAVKSYKSMPKTIYSDTLWKKYSQFLLGNYVYNSIIEIGRLTNVAM